MSCEPWPALGIENYHAVEDGDWGYLLIFEDGHFEFDSEMSPERTEILDRWSAYLMGESETSHL